MVAAKDEEVLGILDLVCEQQADGLQGLLATVYVVAEEEVVGLWGESAVLEQTEQIVVLAMYVTTDLNMELATAKKKGRYVPCACACTVQTFIGASSSSRMGCEMKISRALVHRYRISVSSNCTCLPGRLPLTSRRRSMMESRSTSFSAIAGSGYGLLG